MKPTYADRAQSIKKMIGRTYEQVNCWDLCRDFYMTTFGVELKNYYGNSTPAREETRALIFSNAGEFTKVDDPEFGDLIVMKVRGVESHIGIYLDGKEFLHSVQNAGVCLAKMDQWRNGIVGFYRLGVNRNG